MKRITLFLLLGLMIFWAGCGDIWRPIISEEVTVTNGLALDVKIEFHAKEIMKLKPTQSDVSYQSEGDVLTGVVFKEGKEVGTLVPYTVPRYSDTNKHSWYILGYVPKKEG